MRCGTTSSPSTEPAGMNLPLLDVPSLGGCRGGLRVGFLLVPSPDVLRKGGFPGANAAPGSLPL